MKAHVHEKCALDDGIVICYSKRMREYGIPVGDNVSYIGIRYCPWCGKRLPDSLREEWVEALIAEGYDCPFEDDIPEAFQTDAWWKQK